MDNKTIVIIILGIIVIGLFGYFLTTEAYSYLQNRDKKIAQDTATLLNQLIFQAIQQQGYIQLGYNNQTLILVPYKQ